MRTNVEHTPLLSQKPESNNDSSLNERNETSENGSAWKVMCAVLSLLIVGIVFWVTNNNFSLINKDDTLAIINSNDNNSNRVTLEPVPAQTVPKNHWTFKAPLEDTETITLYFAVKQTNVGQTLDAKLFDISFPNSPNYGHFMTSQEIHDFLSPDVNSIATVNAWIQNAAKDYGIDGRCCIQLFFVCVRVCVPYCFTENRTKKKHFFFEKQKKNK